MPKKDPNDLIDVMRLKHLKSFDMKDIGNFNFRWPYIVFSDYQGWIYVVNCNL